MFAKFRALYPTGQLISELVTIYQGKFVVRTLVQLDGKTLVTAMSAGDTVELAEEQAWKRSLSLLDLNAPIPLSTSPETEAAVRLHPGTDRSGAKVDVLSTSPAAVIPPVPQREVAVTPEKISHSHQGSFVNTQSQVNQAAYLSPPEPVPSPQPPKAASVSLPPKQLDSDAWLSSSYGVSSQGLEISSIPSRTDIKSEMAFSSESHNSPNVSEVEPLSTMGAMPTAGYGYATPLEISPPSELIEDNSEAIAQIDVLLKRLKWKKEQETEYLLKAYGKMSQALLARDELLDFLDYLEIFAKTTEEITRLGWDSKQGRDYLKQAYGEIARHHLSKEQLVDFLQYLESN